MKTTGYIWNRNICIPLETLFKVCNCFKLEKKNTGLNVKLYKPGVRAVEGGRQKKYQLSLQLNNILRNLTGKMLGPFFVPAQMSTSSYVTMTRK